MAFYVRRGLIALTIFASSLIAIDGFFGAVRNGNTPITGLPGALLGFFFGLLGFGFFGFIAYWIVRAIEAIFTIGRDKSAPKTHEARSMRIFQSVLIGFVLIIALFASLTPSFRYTNSPGTSYPTVGFGGVLFTFISIALTFAIATVPIYWIALAIQWGISRNQSGGPESAAQKGTRARSVETRTANQSLSPEPPLDAQLRGDDFQHMPVPQYRNLVASVLKSQ
jgi:hypothetical protein